MGHYDGRTSEIVLEQSDIDHKKLLVYDRRFREYELPLTDKAEVGQTIKLPGLVSRAEHEEGSNDRKDSQKGD